MSLIPVQPTICAACHSLVFLPQRRTRLSETVGGPICADCSIQKPYEEGNTLFLGEPDGAPAFSIEFEVCGCELSSSSELLRAWALLPYGYLRTEDESVSDEYKSPRYQAFSAFETALPVLDQLRHLVDSCCGTHIHIACPRKDWLVEHFWEVFEGLFIDWNCHPRETHAFWGRSTAPYGTSVRVSGRYDTLEFRLPRFRTAAQYRAVVLFCRQTGQMLNGWLANVSGSVAFGRSASLVGEALLDLYQQACSTALATPTRSATPH